MQEKKYLLINMSLNPPVCENSCVWDGDTSKWNPPKDFIAVLSDTINCLDWEWDENSKKWNLIETIGTGKIGYIWDGEKLITNHTEPNYIPKA